MSAGPKLALGGCILAAATGYLAWLGAESSWQYYLTVDECVAERAGLGDSRLRVHGSIVPASLRVSSDRSTASFDLSGTQHRLHVACGGELPDNLTENMEVVVEGRLDASGQLIGDRVLTQCASKYRAEPAFSDAEVAGTELAERQTGGVR